MINILVKNNLIINNNKLTKISKKIINNKIIISWLKINIKNNNTCKIKHNYQSIPSQLIGYKIKSHNSMIHHKY